MRYQRLSPTFAAVLWFTLLHCPGALRAQTNPEVGTATLSGRVTLSGKPARGVKVTLVPGPYGSPNTRGRQSVRADDEGNYEFKGLAAGRYGILAASYVYVSEDLLTASSKTFKLCTVAAGDKLTGQDIRLVRGAVITGRVTDADGKPAILEQVQLSYFDAAGKRQNFSTPVNEEMWQTDDRGVYRLYGLPPGRYLVSAGKETGGSTTGSKRGFYRRVYYPGVAEAERAEALELRAGGEATGIDLRLGPLETTFAVSGRVLDALSGQAVPGAWTDFYVFNNQTNQLRLATSGDPVNERGEFHLTGLLPGRYGISGTPDAARNYYGELVAIEIKDEDLAGLEIKLQRGATLSGTIALDGVLDPTPALQRVKLWLRSISLNPGNSALPRDLPTASVLADGSFQLKALPPGKVRLELGGGEHNFSFQRIERNGVVQQDAFELQAGEQVTGLRVVLAQTTGALRGRVVLPGLLATDWLPEVTLRRADGGAQLESSVPLDAANGFLLTTLAVGEYEITVKLTGKNASNNQPPEPLRRRVTVREGVTTEVQLQVEPR